MAKNDNAHSLRLAAAIRKHIGEAAGIAFEEKFPLSKSASVEKKYIWAKSVCDYLEEHFDAPTILNLRKECRCNDGKSIADKLLKYLKNAETLEAFVRSFNENESFASLEYLAENRLLFCYPECYCACVKRAEGLLTSAWCLCTLGNAESIFRQVFQRDVKVVLRESIKTGGTRCAMEVEWES